jgi:hypothetical protein
MVLTQKQERKKVRLMESNHLPDHVLIFLHMTAMHQMALRIYVIKTICNKWNSNVDKICAEFFNILLGECNLEVRKVKCAMFSNNVFSKNFSLSMFYKYKYCAVYLTQKQTGALNRIFRS